MEEQAGNIVSALLQGEYSRIFMIALIFAVTHYGVFVISYVSGKLQGGIAWARGRVNEIPMFAGTDLDDRFFDLLLKATSNQANLNGAAAEAVADGTLNKADLDKLVDAIWADLKANLGVNDWQGLALQLLGNPSAPGVERALRARFDANVHAVIGEQVGHVAERRQLVRSRKLRAMQGPGQE